MGGMCGSTMWGEGLAERACWGRWRARDGWRWGTWTGMGSGTGWGAARYRRAVSARGAFAVAAQQERAVGAGATVGTNGISQRSGAERFGRGRQTGIDRGVRMGTVEDLSPRTGAIRGMESSGDAARTEHRAEPVDGLVA